MSKLFTEEDHTFFAGCVIQFHHQLGERDGTQIGVAVAEREVPGNIHAHVLHEISRDLAHGDLGWLEVGIEHVVHHHIAFDGGFDTGCTRGHPGVFHVGILAGLIVVPLILTQGQFVPANLAQEHSGLAQAGFGVCMIVFALSKNFYLSATCLLLSGSLDFVSVVVRSSILQLFTSNEMKGRVSAVNSIFVGSSNELGAFESGAAASLMGLVPSVVFGGVMTLIVVAVATFSAPKLRNLSLRNYSE